MSREGKSREREGEKTISWDNDPDTDRKKNIFDNVDDPFPLAKDLAASRKQIEDIVFPPHAWVVRRIHYQRVAQNHWPRKFRARDVDACCSVRLRCCPASVARGL